MEINFDKLDELIENNYKIVLSKTKKIELLSKREVIDEEDSIDEISEDTIIEDDDSFVESIDSEIEEYVSFYNNLKEDCSFEDVLAVLPVVSNNRYNEIVLRLKAESLKEIHDLYELCSLEEEKDDESLEEYFSAIRFHQRKMSLLDECNKTESIEIGEEHKNKLILCPTTGGNIRLIEELNHISMEYYPDFLDLVNSIVDGTFKNYKRFTSVNNKLQGIAEVKGFKVRIVFSRVGVDSYALISAFVKKSDIDKGYVSTLSKKVSDYYCIKDKLIRNLNNEEFLEENDKNVKELYDTLNSYQANNVYKKGGLNG